MKNILIALTVLAIVSACTSVQKIGKNEYQVTVKSGPLDSIDSLKDKVNTEAKKICASGQYEFVKNWMGDDFAFKQDMQYTQYGDFNHSTAVAKIRCLEEQN